MPAGLAPPGLAACEWLRSEPGAWGCCRQRVREQAHGQKQEIKLNLGEIFLAAMLLG